MKRLLVAVTFLGCRKSEDPGSVVRVRVPGRARGHKLQLREGADSLLKSLSQGGDSETPSRRPSPPLSLAREVASPRSLPVPEKVTALPGVYLRHENPLVRWWAAEAAGLARRKDLIRELSRMIARRDVAGSMAAWALGMIGESSGVAALARGISDARPGLRLSCANSLRLIEGGRASRALASGLSSPDYRIRAICATELGRRKHGLWRLSRLWRNSHEPPAVRAAAAAPFAARGESEAFRYLDALASRGGPAARVLALRALGETSLAEAVVSVAAALEAREEEVWQEAAAALARLPREEVTRTLEALERGGSVRATVVLGAVGFERAYDRLEHAYEHGDGALKRFACAALAFCRDARAVGLLASASRAERLSLRVTALRALGLRGDARGLEPLLHAASDADPRVRMEAASSLGRIPDERARGALLALTRDPNGGVRYRAMFALRRKTAADRPGSPRASR